MPIRVTCACGMPYHFRDEAAGRKVACSACRRWIQIPALPPAPTAAPGPIAPPQPAATRTVRPRPTSRPRPSAAAGPLAPGPAAQNRGSLRATVARPKSRRNAWRPIIVGLGLVTAAAAIAVAAWHFGLADEFGAAAGTNLKPPASTSGAAAPAAAVAANPGKQPSDPAPVAAPAGSPTVSIVKGDDPATLVPAALALIGGLAPILKEGQTVVIKPNLVTPDKAERPGLMTDVRLVEALVKEIQKTVRCRIIIAEGSAAQREKGLTTVNAFMLNGYTDLAKRYGLELKDLNEDQRRTVSLPGLRGRPSYPMPETIMTCDVLIDMPVLKTHNIAGVTLGIKNLFGLMPMPKMAYHGDTLEATLADIVRIRPPDLVVVDGLVGTEGEGPLDGTPINVGVVLAGRNVVATDAVAAAIMGFDPKAVRHIALAAEGGLGTNDLSKIAVKGQSIQAVARPFLQPVELPSMAAGRPPAAPPLRLYVGTYTGKSKGIYTLTMDPATGALSAPEVAAETAHPSFLALDPSGRFLYAVNETGDFGGQKTGSVTAFAIAPATGKLSALGRPQPSGGTAPCHLVVDPAGKYLVVANYGSGTLEVLPLGKDGALGEPTSTVQHQGTGPNRGRQEGPHAHGVGFDPAGKVLLAADLGADKLFTYRLDEATGKLAPGAQPSAPAATPGSGPRHFAFSPSGKFLYAINELNSTVGVYAYDAARGSLTVVQSVEARAEGGGGAGGGAEIAVHPSGKFVYASVRGANSIALFTVNPATGELARLGTEPTQGGGPRHFALDPSGAFLIAANQDSDNLVVFRIDPATGKLAATGAKVEVPTAVCVTFLAPAK